MQYRRCLEAHKTAELIARNDLQGAPACLDACLDVLWDCHAIVYGMFDYYSACGSSDDIFHVQLNSYKSIVEGCGLFEAGSNVLNLTAFDQLFVAVTAGKKGDSARSLNRQEFLQCLIRFAILRHVQPRSKGALGAFDTVADALRYLLMHEMVPSIDRRALHDVQTFREESCYVQDMDTILRAFEFSLKSIYIVYSKGDGGIGDELKSTKMMDYSEWKELVKDLQLVEEDFTSREVSLTFLWSRMRVVKPELLASKVKLIQLSFTDFLEALVRVACTKAFPTDEEIFDYGCEDAGDFILKIRGDPQDHMTFLENDFRPWGAPLQRPAYQLTECLCNLMMRTISTTIAASDPRKAIRGPEDVTQDDVQLFKKLARLQRAKN